MRKELKNLWQHPMMFVKAAGAVILVLIILSLVIQLIGGAVGTLHFNRSMTAPFGGARNMAYDGDMAVQESMGRDDAAPSAMPVSPGEDGFVPGDDAEDFEVTEYRASIRSLNKEKECAELAELKSRDDVIFERVNESENGCNYSFKVRHESAEEILEFIKNLDPKDLSENTYTIKRSVDSVTNEQEILEEKLASINETLENALAAYDEITEIATNAQDAESLATVIDSKVRLIERLTQERIHINEQLNRLQRRYNDQLERLDYTYFHVSVYEDKYVDFEDIKDSWKDAVQSFFQTANAILQGLTIGIFVFLLYVAQFVLYFFILLIVAKYGWKYTKMIWKK